MSEKSKENIAAQSIDTLIDELADRLSLSAQQAQALCFSALIRHIERTPPFPVQPSEKAFAELGITSRRFARIYEELGIDVTRFGHVMLPLEPLDIVMHVPDGEQDLYYSTNPHFKYVQGAVGEKDPHLTLLSGLQQPAPDYADQIATVLEAWQPSDIFIETVSYFDTPDPDEPYYVIVGKVQRTTHLLEAHARLKLLPHVSTFTDYAPHVTLAYVRHEDEILHKWLTNLSDRFNGVSLEGKVPLKLT